MLCQQLPRLQRQYASVAGELVFRPPQKSPKKHFRKTLSANFFGLRFKLNSDSVCGNWDKNRPIIEVTALSWVHGMGEELRAGGRSASGDTRRDEPEFGMGRVTGISLPGYCP
jgi:hypothetical protein